MELARVCSRCGVEKLLSEYFRNQRSKGGYLQFCKKCRVINNSRKILTKSLLDYRKRNPEKAFAQKIVRRKAIFSESTKQTCAICNASDVEAHHSDYSRPLLISWLCRKHHLAVHRIFRGELAVKAKDYSRVSQ